MSYFQNSHNFLGLIISSTIVYSANSAIAQIIQDGTLPNNSQVRPQENITTIEGGTLSQDGNNLFHSFKEFSVPENHIVEFKYNGNVQNIISRVTGNSVSQIDGILKVSGIPNLFIINPNGIIFGANASLDIGGSFIATTASSLNFSDGNNFSAVSPTTIPLLAVSVPVGLQFGTVANPIRNQSQASPNGITNSFRQPVGLQVQAGKTLALVGGNLVFEGGNLTAKSGRIELGSVAANSFVSLKPTSEGWALGYEGVQKFQNIQLIQRIDNYIQIPSQISAVSQDKEGGSIQVHGNLVELTGNRVLLTTQSRGIRDGGDLTITAKKISIQDGAQVFASTINKGKGGNLIVKASDAVELVGSLTMDTITGLINSTAGQGKAGDITINTGKLRILNGAVLVAEITSPVIPDAGKGGGNITVNALESVEIAGISIAGDPSTLSASSTNSSGDAGDINVNARSIRIENQGKITTDSLSGQGGNIRLNVRDLLLMRRDSQISTNAGSDGNGGNITINARNGFLVAPTFGNNDITANANFGSGGKITINAKSIFGFVPRTRADLVRELNTEDPKQLNPNKLDTNDITAFSQQSPSFNGTVEINSPDVDPSKGLVELPVNVVDASTQIAASCNGGGKLAKGKFTVTGRGGIPSNPIEQLTAEAVLADWITLEPEINDRANALQNRTVNQEQLHPKNYSQLVNSVTETNEIVEAQGWMVDPNGNVVLVAQVPAATLHSPALTTVSCAAN
jgi:filamentous hemagglutinin family protein